MKPFETILILAGGDSSRFWPLSDKNLIKFFDKPLIFYLIEKINKFGKKLIVVLNEENKKNFLFWQKKITLPKIKVVAQQKNLTGMAGAILSAKEEVVAGSLLVLNGSDVFEFLVIDHLRKKINKEFSVALLAKKMTDYFPGGYLQFSKNGQLKGLIEKPDSQNLPSSYVRLVADSFFDSRLLIKILINRYKGEDDDYEKTISNLLKKNRGDFYEYLGEWHCLKYPWHVLSMMKYFLSAEIKKNLIDSSVSISKKAVIIPPVFLDAEVKIGDFAKVVGPTYIGKGTKVGDHTLIYQSHIGNYCLIGGYSEVTRSYLGDRVFLHRNYVGDSVFDDDVFIGAGAVTANVRFDSQLVMSMINQKKMRTNRLKLGAIIGKRSKVGVNATLLPGVKIGQETLIGPGQIVSNDIPERKFFFKNRLVNNFLNKKE